MGGAGGGQMTWDAIGFLLACAGAVLGLAAFIFLLGRHRHPEPPPWRRAALLGTVAWVLACGVLLGLAGDRVMGQPFSNRRDGLGAALYLAGAAVFSLMAWRPSPRALPLELGGSSPRSLRLLALLFAFMGIWRLTDFALG